jgi:hypothetical protein
LLLAIAGDRLWSWSLGSNHDTIALVSGVVLVFCTILLAWMLVVGAARLVASATQRRSSANAAVRTSSSRSAAPPASGESLSPDASPAPLATRAGTGAGGSRTSPPSSKLAA